MQNIFVNLPYPKFKLAIVFLLLVNFLVYAIADTWIKGLDALVWLALLILYELEANKVAESLEPGLGRLRTILVILVPLVFLGYMKNKEWLDVVNSLFWFALIALLESEIRWPETVFEYRNIYWLATIIVLGGLAVMVLVWLWRSAWLDAYDAALWLVAFSTIEVDIFKIFQRKSA